MAKRGRIKGISRHVKALLLEGESERGDFKRAPDGVNLDDLVAFANSENGGTILVGVDERAGPAGAQIGVVVGCDVSDAAILQIANKALSCLPPVGIEVGIENLDQLPFLRLEIAPSATKPHCTPKGVYCRRDGSRNRPLHPSELLKIFLESESRAFAQRFEAAAGRINEDLSSLETNLGRSIRAMADQLGWAESNLDSSESLLHTILAYTKRLDDETKDLTTRLRSVFRQDGRQDPIFDRERKKLLDEFVDRLAKDKDLLNGIKAGRPIQVSAQGLAAVELKKEDLESVVHEAVEIATARLERQKYSIRIKKPDECDGDEIKGIINLIVEGGEVGKGIERRLMNAAQLGLLFYEKRLVGTAALKRPASRYRDAVFDKAHASHASATFPFELGWIFLRKEHRSKGQARPLIKTVLKTSKTQGIFATTRESNAKMQKILLSEQFERDGASYPSVQHPGEQILLFVRPATRLQKRKDP